MPKSKRILQKSSKLEIVLRKLDMLTLVHKALLFFLQGKPKFSQVVSSAADWNVSLSFHAFVPTDGASCLKNKTVNTLTTFSGFLRCVRVPNRGSRKKKKKMTTKQYRKHSVTWPKNWGHVRSFLSSSTVRSVCQMQPFKKKNTPHSFISFKVWRKFPKLRSTWNKRVIFKPEARITIANLVPTTPTMHLWLLYEARYTGRNVHESSVLNVFFF